jgi:adenosylmethionine-8-amino-7-oxononanoate aminotransferase
MVCMMPQPLPPSLLNPWQVTGVLPPPKGYLERLRAICDKHGILLIFDEVITGFGRLGYAFAAERYGVVPDMITFAKGVTSRGTDGRGCAGHL